MFDINPDCCLTISHIRSFKHLVHGWNFGINLTQCMMLDWQCNCRTDKILVPLHKFILNPCMCKGSWGVGGIWTIISKQCCHWRHLRNGSKFLRETINHYRLCTIQIMQSKWHGHYLHVHAQSYGEEVTTCTGSVHPLQFLNKTKLI